MCPPDAAENRSTGSARDFLHSSSPSEAQKSPMTTLLPGTAASAPNPLPECEHSAILGVGSQGGDEAGPVLRRMDDSLAWASLSTGWYLLSFDKLVQDCGRRVVCARAHVTPETSSHSLYKLLLILDPTAMEESRAGTISTGPILESCMRTKKTLRGKYCRNIHSLLVALSIWQVMTLILPSILPIFLRFSTMSTYAKNKPSNRLCKRS